MDIRLATRGSELAVRQAGTVKDRLSNRRRSVELVEVETKGDQIQDELLHRLGKTGAFVRTLDEQVLAGELDAAVHSMKDMPTEFPENLVVGAVLERGPAGDVLVTPDGASFDELPDGATIGTGSLRRTAQLNAQRDDVNVEPIRGNVDTRIEKLLAPSLQREHERRVEKVENGELGQGAVDEWFEDRSPIEQRALERDVDTEYDALVMAEAGLERSGLLHHVAFGRFDPERFVPAAGQGAIAVTAPDGEMAELLTDIDHPRTRVETTVERTILAELNGGCIAPIGVYAVVRGQYVHTVARVLSVDGEESIQTSRDIPIATHGRGAVRLAEELIDRGADELVETARENHE
ncbi:hydroxymethylbilane synthase [Halosegnis rubeus]|mgnify:FL=1|jgi:hydroxymethylbilane synthase|uniref:Hydroxymethylbilane synthase n=1 Tax=Halosegnis rubeus TaxID=2212850 RepID=A0A5N5UFC5_9EURY|nr:hydroxymethylbilane synthase [Halosegnis rubeus]KAB7516371.1 hydroxymethylbilane synthase [Halosegnis rubeus]KAB7517641.1 hydroxymethylbilane synthase [Halosegnis rubeus]